MLLYLNDPAAGAGKPQRSVALQAIGSALRPAQRHGVPGFVECPRDHVTLYNGKVLSMVRSPRRTVIRIRTDFDTTEQVQIRYAKEEELNKWFRLDGEPFKTADWSRIESKKGHLKKGVRANIWVCDDGANPLVDWQSGN
jgi:hypothetical protein